MRGRARGLDKISLLLSIEEDLSPLEARTRRLKVIVYNYYLLEQVNQDL